MGGQGLFDADRQGHLDAERGTRQISRAFGPFGVRTLDAVRRSAHEMYARLRRFQRQAKAAEAPTQGTAEVEKAEVQPRRRMNAHAGGAGGGTRAHRASSALSFSA